MLLGEIVELAEVFGMELHSFFIASLAAELKLVDGHGEGRERGGFPA